MSLERTESSKSEEAFFVFTDSLNDVFVFKLTDPERIRKARDILSGRENHAKHVSGVIVKEPVDYNPKIRTYRSSYGQSCS